MACFQRTLPGLPLCAAPAAFGKAASIRRSLPAHAASPRRNTVSRAPRQPDQLVEETVEELLAAAKAATAAEGVEFHGRVECAKVQAEVERLQQQASRLGVDRVNIDLNDGEYFGVLTTDMRKIDLNNITTLGRLSFNQAAPVDLQIQLDDNEGKALTGLPDQVKGLYNGVPQSYVVNSHFKILPKSGSGSPSGSGGTSGSSSPEECIHGVMSAIGLYEVLGEEQPQRLSITFKKLVLRPADDKRQLTAWLEALAPHNPSMRKEDGVLEIHLPSSSPKGSLDYMLMTSTWQISKGNLGSIVVMRRSGATN